MTEVFPYLSIDEEPPGRKLGHYKLRKPILLKPLNAVEQAFVDGLVKRLDDEILHGKRT